MCQLTVKNYVTVQALTLCQIPDAQVVRLYKVVIEKISVADIGDAFYPIRRSFVKLPTVGNNIRRIEMQANTAKRIDIVPTLIALRLTNKDLRAISP